MSEREERGDARLVEGIAEGLQQAVALARTGLDDSTAEVVLITPSETNSLLARRSLAEAGAFVRVRYATPEQAVWQAARIAMADQGLRPEPPAWLGGVVASALAAPEAPRVDNAAVQADVDRYWRTLAMPGWQTTVEQALGRLELAGASGAALRQAARGIPEHAARLAIMAHLLEILGEERQRLGIYSLAQAAALPVASTRRGRCGVVVLGDRTLGPAVYRWFVDWLTRSSAVELAVPPAAQQPPAPLGMRQALLEAGCSQRVLVAAQDRTPLGRLKRSLFVRRAADVSASELERPDRDALPSTPAASARALTTADGSLSGQPGAVTLSGQPGAVTLSGQPGAVALPGQPGAVALSGQPGDSAVDTQSAGAVVLARTADEVREQREVARIVVDEVRRGTPLDRIAVALPDGAQADVLRDELSRAQIPAVFLVGPPLLRAPLSRALLLALDIACGEENIWIWNELLRQPSLMLRRRLGPNEVMGRARWTRILRTCGAVTGTANIIAAVERFANEVVSQSATPVDVAGDSRPADESATQNRFAALGLANAIRTLDAIFQAWQQPASLGVRGEQLARFVGDWWARSQVANQIVAGLREWGPRAGSPIRLPRTVVELRRMLSEAIAVSGSLDAPVVRIAPPMALLGGEFDCVCLAGLTQDRLPRERREDPLLSDALIAELCQRAGLPLLDSRQLQSAEPLRFASAVGACVGRLWLCAPQVEMRSGRELLASRFLLESASALAGRAIGYRELPSLTRRLGSRSCTFTSDESLALDENEARLARLAADPQRELAEMLAEPAARRLLAFTRGLGRASELDLGRLIDFVDPLLAACPGLDGVPLSVERLSSLLANPGAFFFRTVLRAWPEKRLPTHVDLADRQANERRLLSAIERALETSEGELAARVQSALHDDLQALRVAEPRLTAEQLDLVERDSMRAFEAFFSLLDSPLEGPRCAVAAAQVLPTQPFTLEGEYGREIGDTLIELQQKKPKGSASGGETMRLALQALAARGQGRGLQAIRTLALDGIGDRIAIDEGLSGACELELQRATRMGQIGWWPFLVFGRDANRKRPVLAADHTLDRKLPERLNEALMRLEAE